MSEYEYVVIRWPYEVTGSDADFTFREIGVPTFNAQSVADGIYISSGDLVVVEPMDFLKAFVAAAQAAATAIAGVGGTFTGALGDDGRAVFTHTGMGNGLGVTGLTANQMKWLGASASAVTLSNSTMGFQMGCMWYPGIDQNYNSDKEERSILHEDRGLAGNIRRLELASADWDEITLDWDRIFAARMKDSRAADAAYCSVAGIQTGEVNTWENMRRYLKGEPGPFGDNRVYIYQSNIAGPGVIRLGPYDYILGSSRPGLKGIEAKSFVQGLAQEKYSVMAVFMEIL